MRQAPNSSRARRALALLVMLAVFANAPVAHAVDLGALLLAGGDTVTLDPTATYTIGDFLLSTDKTIECHGAQITSTGPIGMEGAGNTLTIDDCRIAGSGWAVLAVNHGAALVVRNGTRLTGPGTNTGIYVLGSTADVEATTIERFQVGVLVENSEAAIRSAVVDDTDFAIQTFAGTVTVDGCTLTNLDTATPGSGVDLHASPTYPGRASIAVVRDTTFTGFGNAVGIQPTVDQGLPAGSAEIIGCTFTRPLISAVIAVDANVRFANSRVVDAQTDGIYFQNSVGLVEDSQVLNSLNTGVSFFGCPNGGMIRNSLIVGSVHQGVAVTVDPSSGRTSHGVRVVDNTLKDNVIANVLVDSRSDAVVQGNIMVGGPNADLRVHDSSTASILAALSLDTARGLETREGSTVITALSAFARHPNSDVVSQNNASVAISHCSVDGDGLENGSYAIDASVGGRVTVARSTLGPAGSRAFQNRSGTASTAIYDYWGDPSGPKKGGGSGALIAGRYRTRFDPFLAAPPVEARIERAFAMGPGETSTFTTDVGVTLSLTGAPATTQLSGLVAALRVWDAGTLTAPAPPVGTYADGVAVVWAEVDVLSRASGGSLRLRTAGDGRAATLFHLDGDGQWRALDATWDDAAGEIVYAPADPRLLQGVFAFGDGQGCASARECLAPLAAGIPCTDISDARIQRVVARKLKAAFAKLDAAAGSGGPKFAYQARKALQVTDVLLSKGVRKHTVSVECRNTVAASLNAALQRIDANAL